MQFHNTLDPATIPSETELVNNPARCELFIGTTLNRYCQTHGDIAGYEQIERFHDYLISINAISGIECIIRKPDSGMDRSHPIPDAVRELKSFLLQNANNADHYYAAMILFLVGTKAHSVFLGYDNDFYIRDGNFDHVCGNTGSFGFVFDDNSQICEYMIFKISK